MNWQEWWDKTKCILALADDREEVARLAYKAGMERAAEICDDAAGDCWIGEPDFLIAEKLVQSIHAEAASLSATEKEAQGMSAQEWWDKVCILRLTDSREDAVRLASKTGMEFAAEAPEREATLMRTANHEPSAQSVDHAVNHIRKARASLHADSRQPDSGAATG